MQVVTYLLILNLEYKKVKYYAHCKVYLLLCGTILYSVHAACTAYTYHKMCTFACVKLSQLLNLLHPENLHSNSH